MHGSGRGQRIFEINNNSRRPVMRVVSYQNGLAHIHNQDRRINGVAPLRHHHRTAIQKSTLGAVEPNRKGKIPGGEFEFSDVAKGQLATADQSIAPPQLEYDESGSGSARSIHSTLPMNYSTPCLARL